MSRNSWPVCEFVGPHLIFIFKIVSFHRDVEHFFLNY